MTITMGFASYGVIEEEHGAHIATTVGKYCSIGPGVKSWICGGHHYNFITTFSHTGVSHVREKAIYIENDVWIGTGAILLGGTHIENGAVIGAASVVRGGVPAYSVVIGNPAQVVKYRFSKEDIETLLKIAWWNWPKKDIDAAMLEGVLRSTSVANLVQFDNKRRGL